MLFEFRSSAAVLFDSLTHTSVAGCVAKCMGIPKCPGIQFGGDADGGTCYMVSESALRYHPLMRGHMHMIMRRGFLTSATLPPTLVAAADAATAWTSDLSDQVAAANADLTQLQSRVELRDPIWAWIDSKPWLKKSVYSLGFPTHPKVIEHLRYLKNFLGAEHDVDGDLAHAIVAFAFK